MFTNILEFCWLVSQKFIEGRAVFWHQIVSKESKCWAGEKKTLESVKHFFTFMLKFFERINLKTILKLVD